MHIIDKKFFKTAIASKDLFENDIFPPIPSKYVFEKKLKKRYVYSLKKDSAIFNAQQNIIDLFLRKIDVNNCAVGFRKDKSYLNFLEPHSGNYYFLRLDIRNFFHSIDEKLLKDCFSPYFKDEFIDAENKQKLISSFLNLVTFHVGKSYGNIDFVGKKIVPVGFPSSPFISNIYFRNIDVILQKLCALHDITYTRYADDLLFSSSRDNKFVHSDSFEKEVKVILSSRKLKVNEKKIVKAKHRISLNGYVIQSTALVNNKNDNNVSGIFISNKKTSILKKVLHEFESKPVNYTKIMERIFKEKIRQEDFFYPITLDFKKKYYKTQARNKICGFRAYLISFIKFNAIYGCIPECRIQAYKKLICQIDTFLV
ncbi:hypothetical protein F4826_002401 [Rahnella inusitata]|nr:hypothetical protein [Rahnella inusitata]